jgi:hypothetical protein
MNKVVLTPVEQDEINRLLMEFKERGGMDDKELISRLNAIPFEEFMDQVSKKIRKKQDK